MRRILIVASGLVLALVGLALLALAALSHGWQREWLRNQLEEQLSASLGTRVTFEAIAGPLHREFVVRGLRVGDPAAPWVEAAELRVRVESLQLGDVPTLRLATVRIDAPRLDLSAAAESSIPAEAAEPADAPAAWPLRVELGSLAIHDGRLERNDAALRLRLDLEADVRELALDGTAAADAVSIDFELSDPEHGAKPWGRGAATGRFTNTSWELDTLRLAGPELEVDAHGRGDTTSLGTLQLELRAPSIERLLARLSAEPAPLAGAIEVSAALHGPFHWPQGTASLRARNLFADDVALGNVDLEARSAREGELVIEALQLSGGPIDLESVAAATLSTGEERTSLSALRLRRPDAKGTLELEASLPGLAEASLEAAIGHPATRVSLKTRAWPLAALRPLFQLAGIQAEGTLDAQAVVRSKAGKLVAEASGRVQGGSLRVDELVATGAELSFDVAGEPSAPAFGIRGAIAALQLGPHSLGALDLDVRSDAGRTLTVEQLSLSGGVVPLDVEPGSRVRIVGDRFELAGFQLESAGQRIAADGVIEGTDSKGLTLRVDGLDVERTLETLVALGWVEPTPVRGRIDGEIVWHGTFADPKLSADLVGSDVWLGDFAFDRVSARAETEGAEMRIESDWTQGRHSPLRLRAALPRNRVFGGPRTWLEDPGSRIEAQIQDFDLVALAPFLPSGVSEIRGVVDAQIEARGGATRREISGALTLAEGSLGLEALGEEPLGAIAAQLRFDNDRISLERFTIGTSEVGVSGSGNAHLEGDRLADVDLRLVFSKYPIDARGLVRGTLSGPVRLSGEPKAFALSGQLDLANLQIAIPEEDDPTVKEIRVISADGADADLAIREVDAEDSILDPVRVDLGIRIARNSWARGRGAEVELQGELHASKERRGPLRMKGSVETVRGTYEIYGRRFRIERGQALLDGATDPDPLLDIRALHRVRDVRIYAIVEGRLSEPRLRFESQPELTETDIASYLLLGRPASGGDGAPPALDAVAAQVAAGAAVREFERLMGGALPVDLLDVRTEKNGDTTELRAGVGKYVGDRLFLHYERGFGAEPEDELNAEYELDANWSVESSISSQGATSADLIFEIEY